MSLGRTGSLSDNTTRGYLPTPSMSPPMASVPVNPTHVWQCVYCKRPNHRLHDPTDCSYCGNYRASLCQEADNVRRINKLQAARPNQTPQSHGILPSNVSHQRIWACDKCLERNVGTINCIRCGHHQSTCCLPFTTFREDPRVQTGFWVCGQCRENNYVPANPDRCTRCYHKYCLCCSKKRLLSKFEALRNGIRPQSGRLQNLPSYGAMNNGVSYLSPEDRLRMLKAATQTGICNIHAPSNMTDRMASTSPTFTQALPRGLAYLDCPGTTSSQSSEIYIPESFCWIQEADRESNNGVFGGDRSVRVENHRLVAWMCTKCGASNSDLTPDFCPLCSCRK